MAVGLTACFGIPGQVEMDPPKEIPPIQLENPVLSFRPNTMDMVVEWTLPNAEHGFVNGFEFEVLNNQGEIIFKRYFSYDQDHYWNMSWISHLQRNSTYDVRVRALGGWFDYDEEFNMVEVFDSTSNVIVYNTEYTATVTNIRLERVQNFVFLAFDTNMVDILAMNDPRTHFALRAVSDVTPQGVAASGNDLTLAGNILGAERHWIMLSNGAGQRSEWSLHALMSPDDIEVKFCVMVRGRGQDQHSMSQNVGNRRFHDSGWIGEVSFTQNFIPTPVAQVNGYSVTWDVPDIMPRYFFLEFVGWHPNYIGETTHSVSYRFYAYDSQELADAIADGMPNIGSFEIVGGKITVDIRDLNPTWDYLAPRYSAASAHIFYILVGFGGANIFENDTLYVFGSYRHFNDTPSYKRMAILGLYELFFQMSS